MIKYSLKSIVGMIYLYSGLSHILSSINEMIFKRKNIIIIMYHGVDEKRLKYADNISLNNFKEQIEHLINNYEIVSLKTALDYISSNQNLKKPLVVLTFDDGYKSVYEMVSPYLKARGIPAITFVPTRYIGKEGDWERLEKGFMGEIMGWDMLKALAADQAIAIGSHGASHRAYSSMKDDEIYGELVESKNSLEKNLGKKIEYFSYPYGQAPGCSKKICNQVRNAGYLAACSTIWGRYSSAKNIYTLRRIRIDYQDSFYEFKLKINGAYDWIEGIHLLKGILSR